MATYNTPAMNGTGVDELLVDIGISVPIFIPAFLLFVFGVITITGARKQYQKTGVADIPLWATLGGVVASVVALLLSTKEGLIDLATLTITIVITIIFGIWLFASRDRT